MLAEIEVIRINIMLEENILEYLGTFLQNLHRSIHDKNYKKNPLKTHRENIIKMCQKLVQRINKVALLL